MLPFREGKKRRRWGGYGVDWGNMWKAPGLGFGILPTRKRVQGLEVYLRCVRTRLCERARADAIAIYGVCVRVVEDLWCPILLKLLLYCACVGDLFLECLLLTSRLVPGKSTQFRQCGLSQQTRIICLILRSPMVQNGGWIATEVAMRSEGIERRG